MIKSKKGAVGADIIPRELIGAIIAIAAILIIFGVGCKAFSGFLESKDEKIQANALIDKIYEEIEDLNENEATPIFIYGPEGWHLIGFTETNNYDSSGQFKKPVTCYRKNCICACKKKKNEKSCVCKNLDVPVIQGESLLFLELRPLVVSIKRTSNNYIFQIIEENIPYFELSKDQKAEIKGFKGEYSEKLESDFELALAFVSKLDMKNQTKIQEFKEKIKVLKSNYTVVSMQILAFICEDCVGKYCPEWDYEACREKLPEEKREFVEEVFSYLYYLEEGYLLEEEENGNNT